MYNEKYKLEYIEKKKSEAVMPNGYLEKQFEKTEFFENKLGKDLSEWTSKEIIEYYRFINCSVLSSLVVLNSQLSMYTQFMLQKNLVKDHQNHFLEISEKIIIERCINKSESMSKVISIEELYKFINRLDNYSDKFIILALFEGMKGNNFSEIINAKTSMIKDGYFILPDRKIKISKKLNDIAIESARQTEYNSFGIRRKVFTLSGDSDQIIKNYYNVKESSEFQKGRRIYIRVQKIIEHTGISNVVNANSIYISGQIYYIKQMAAKREMGVYEYMYSNYFQNDMQEKYGKSISSFRKKDFWGLYKEYLK